MLPWLGYCTLIFFDPLRGVVYVLYIINKFLGKNPLKIIPRIIAASKFFLLDNFINKLYIYILVNIYRDGDCLPCDRKLITNVFPCFYNKIIPQLVISVSTFFLKFMSLYYQ